MITTCRRRLTPRPEDPRVICIKITWKDDPQEAALKLLGKQELKEQKTYAFLQCLKKL